MNDLEIAKINLYGKNLSLCIVKDKKIIFSSKSKGIRPLYELFINNSEGISGASLADRVLGEAGCMICSKLKFKSIYSEIISEKGVKSLENCKIEYLSIVPHILNRKGNDLCPMEKIVKNSRDFQELINNIGKFLKNAEDIIRS